jgi:hypothetical protein
MVELVAAGRTPAELSREFGCSAQTIINWAAGSGVSVSAPRAAPDSALSSAEREELARLRRENRRLNDRNRCGTAFGRARHRTIMLLFEAARIGLDFVQCPWRWASLRQRTIEIMSTRTVVGSRSSPRSGRLSPWVLPSDRDPANGCKLTPPTDLQAGKTLGRLASGEEAVLQLRPVFA